MGLTIQYALALLCSDGFLVCTGVVLELVCCGIVVVLSSTELTVFNTGTKPYRRPASVKHIMEQEEQLERDEKCNDTRGRSDGSTNLRSALKVVVSWRKM